MAQETIKRTVAWLMFAALMVCAAPVTADTVNYSYDDAGRLIRASYASGKVISYSYDKAGNLLGRIVGAAGAAPNITGVVNGANFLPGIAASSWITIQGTNLSATTRTWRGSDFSGNNLPTQLDGVSATVHGLAAYVYYISPTQLNVLAPDDATTGQVAVQVTTAQGASNIFNVGEQAVSPAFFLFTAKYPAAVHADGKYLGKAGLIAGATFIPAKPGEIILLFGTGFGATNPPLPAGKLVTQAAKLANTTTVTIGGKQTTVAFAGLSASGLDQLNVVVPADLPDGDALIVAQVAGASTQANLFLTIQH